MKVCGTALHDAELLQAGDGDRALGRVRLAEKHLAEVEASGAPALEVASAIFELGDAYAGVDDHARSNDLVDRALAVPDFAASDAWARARHSHALRALWRGDHARAEAFARACADAARAASKLEDQLVGPLLTRAEALLGLGRVDEALAATREAALRFAASDWMKKFRPGSAITAKLLEARVLSARGDHEDALRSFAEVEAMMSGENFRTSRFLLDALLAHAEALVKAGRPGEARDRARRACEWWDAVRALRKGDDAEAAARERAALAERWALDLR